jgi:hypothetical protein
MSDYRVTALTPADFPPESLARVAVDMGVLARWLVDAFQKALPTLRLIAAFGQRLEDAPPVPGYQEQLRRHEYHPLAAKFMAYNVRRLGEERVAEAVAGRIIAAAVRGVLAAKDSSDLVLSRRARKFQIALARPIGRTVLESACRKAGDLDAIYTIDAALTAVSNRPSAGREALLAICAKLKPHLLDPRGRKRRLISATHEVFLEVVGRSYTHNPLEDDFVDPATKATRAAFGDPRFDPRPARRRLRKHRASTN